MNVHLFCMVWNESRLMPYFLRHYEGICSRIVVYDDGSDDGTQEIVMAHPKCELRDCSGGDFTQDKMMENRQKWKESKGKADWVICCDIDEFLWHPDLYMYLLRTPYTLPKVKGFQMVSDSFPTAPVPLTQLVRTGFPHDAFSKRIVFKPDAIDEMNYGTGCHHCNPTGNVTEEPGDGELKLLHYKNLGLAHVLARNKAMDSRQNDLERAKGHGSNYRWPVEETTAYFNKLKESGRVVV